MGHFGAISCGATHYGVVQCEYPGGESHRYLSQQAAYICGPPPGLSIRLHLAMTAQRNLYIALAPARIIAIVCRQMQERH